jgi:hypothetical protein
VFLALEIVLLVTAFVLFAVGVGFANVPAVISLAGS